MALSLPQNFSASGGHASNGDTSQNFNSDFGGINYKTGLDPLVILGAVGVALIVYLSVKK